LLLMACAVSMLAMPHYLFGVNSIKEYLLPNRHRYIVMVLSVALLIAVALSYMAQDISYLIQSQRLNTLEQQQDISRALLENLRFFRHNIINMLYGLEGTLLSGDREKLDAYFAEIHEKCALVNNENITALEKVTNPAVSALLMHATDRAHQLNLPLNLYVQENVFFPRVLGDADLCQIVGVLLDNALEAANEASERYVMLELRNVENALELIVSNTYTGTVTIEQLSRGGASTKEGHPGHGLASCYHILSRKRNVHLNFWVTGQYVRAQLLLHR
jgi:two-component system sensor histidine kinase AgrC